MLKKNKLMIKKTILGAVVAMSCMQAFAADYTDGNIRKNDFNWMQMNLMQSVDAKVPYGIRNDTYLNWSLVRVLALLICTVMWISLIF